MDDGGSQHGGPPTATGNGCPSRRTDADLRKSHRSSSEGHSCATTRHPQRNSTVDPGSACEDFLYVFSPRPLGAGGLRPERHMHPCPLAFGRWAGCIPMGLRLRAAEGLGPLRKCGARRAADLKDGGSVANPTTCPRATTPTTCGQSLALSTAGRVEGCPQNDVRGTATSRSTGWHRRRHSWWTARSTSQCHLRPVGLRH